VQRVVVVVPICSEEANLPHLFARLRAVFDRLAIEPGVAGEALYVNDGSTDRSLDIMLDQHRTDARFGILDLSRNFGHQAAIMAGLAEVDADAAIVMDGDLQDPPELIPDLVTAWREGAEVVHADRRTRQETGVRRLGVSLFHSALEWLSDFPIPANVGVFGLLDRRALDELKRLPEKNRFYPGLRAWIGFEQRVIPYDRQPRAAGRPSQSLPRLIRYALDGIFSFSYKPLRLMVAAGIVISALGFLLAAHFILKRVLGIEEAQTGFTTLVTVVLFLGGVQLIATGLLGEYLARIYDEVKRRPSYIVRRRVRRASPDAASLPEREAAPRR
jgi:polyisoprenyl-phosphate glycosyltransferase